MLQRDDLPARLAERAMTMKAVMRSPDFPSKIHRVIAAVHDCSALYDEMMERCIEVPASIRDDLLALYAGSPFIKRLQDWPRGYPGDFETIELMCDARTILAPGHSHYWLEWYALHSGIVLQHRNKIDFQRASMFDGLHAGGRILSIGCGGARDLTPPPAGFRDATIALLDIDPDALLLAERRARLVADDVEVVNIDALRGMRRVKGRWSRIVFGGLFDYFDDRAVTHCLATARRLLEPGGRIIFTNVAGPCRFQAWMDLFTNWKLILRDEDDVMRMVERANWSRDAVHIRRDGTNLSLLCEIADI